MELKKRKLSILQLIGYEEELSFKLFWENLCQLIYELGQKFMIDMIDNLFGALKW